jgi:hypothetical protein
MATTLATGLPAATTADRRARRAADAVISAYLRELAPAVGSPSPKPRADALAAATAPGPARARRHRLRRRPAPPGTCDARRGAAPLSRPR